VQTELEESITDDVLHHHHQQQQQQQQQDEALRSLVEELRSELAQLRLSDDVVRNERDLISRTSVALLQSHCCYPRASYAEPSYCFSLCVRVCVQRRIYGYIFGEASCFEARRAESGDGVSWGSAGVAL